MTLAGCVSLGRPEAPPRVVAERLPPAPAFMAPVPEPEPAGGDDARAVGARYAGALGEANARLIESRGWYERLGEGRR